MKNRAEAGRLNIAYFTLAILTVLFLTEIQGHAQTPSTGNQPISGAGIQIQLTGRDAKAVADNYAAEALLRAQREELGNLSRAKQICSNYIGGPFKSEDPTARDTSCESFQKCQGSITCGDLRAALNDCSLALKAHEPRREGSKKSENDDGDDGESDTKVASFASQCMRYYSRGARVTASESEERRKIFEKFIADSRIETTSDSCRLEQGARALAALSQTKKSVKTELNDAKTSYSSAKKDFLTAKEECLNKQHDILEKRAKNMSALQTESAKVQNEVVESNAAMAANINTLQEQLRLAQEALAKMKTIDKQQLESAYYDEAEKIKQVCYENADQYIEKVKAAQEQQAAAFQNQAASVSHALSNAASGGNGGQNKMVWDSFVKRCLARRAPALTSLYNKSIIAKQTLDTEVRKAEIQVASLMTKIQQADIASKQKQRSQGALASAKMAALQSEIQQISNQDQSYFDPNKGLCTIKMKLAQEERDKSQAKKESLEYDLKEMENIPESEAASAASSNAPSLADELKILEKATGYYTSARNNLIASGKSDEEARKEACTGIGKRADPAKSKAQSAK